MRKKSNETKIAIERFVDVFFDLNKRSPSLREIEAELKISRQTIHRYLREMHDFGNLSYDGKRIGTKHIESLSKMSVRKLPIYGFVSCGNPSLEFQQMNDYLDIPESFLDGGEFFILTASGDSMKNAGIDDGDFVLVKSQSYGNIGEIVVAIDDNGQTTLKRLLYDGNRYYLHPENNDYQDIFLSEFSIQGVAKKVIKEL